MQMISLHRLASIAAIKKMERGLSHLSLTWRASIPQ